MNCATAALIALVACLGDPDPAIRDKVAFERLSVALRGGEVDRATLTAVRAELLNLASAPDPQGFKRPFAILALAEVARTDRIKPWMPDAERQALVDVAAQYLSTLTDYRAFNDKEGFRHGVAHGADLALQLGLNPAITRAQLDRLLSALAVQIAPAATAYTAGEPDRLARAVFFIAQRKLHSEADWTTWFATVMDPKPLPSWEGAFQSEAGIRKRHNARAFLLSVLASVTIAQDPGITQLLNQARNSLKLVP